MTISEIYDQFYPKNIIKHNKPKIQKVHSTGGMIWLDFILIYKFLLLNLYISLTPKINYRRK